MAVGWCNQICIYSMAGGSELRRGGQLGDSGSPGRRVTMGWPQVVAVRSESKGWIPEIEGLDHLVLNGVL